MSALDGLGDAARERLRRLRHPRYQGARRDKDPAEVRGEQP